MLGKARRTPLHSIQRDDSHASYVPSFPTCPAAGAIRQLLAAAADATAGANGALAANTNTQTITATDPFTGSNIAAAFAAGAAQGNPSTANTRVDLNANTGPNSASTTQASAAAGKDATSISAGAVATNPLFGVAGGLTSAAGTGPNSQAAAGNFLAASSLPSCVLLSNFSRSKKLYQQYVTRFSSAGPPRSLPTQRGPLALTRLPPWAASPPLARMALPLNSRTSPRCAAYGAGVRLATRSQPGC